MKKCVIFILFSYCILSLNSQNLRPNTTGSFTYNPSGALSSKSIEVFYHIPNGEVKMMPILMSFHGVNRNAADYRDYWISMANRINSWYLHHSFLMKISQQEIRII